MSMPTRPSRRSQALPKPVSNSTLCQEATAEFRHALAHAAATSRRVVRAVTAATASDSRSSGRSRLSRLSDNSRGAIFHRNALMPSSRNVAVKCSNRLRTSASSKVHHLFLGSEAIAAFRPVAIGGNDLPAHAVTAIRPKVRQMSRSGSPCRSGPGRPRRSSPACRRCRSPSLAANSRSMASENELQARSAAASRPVFRRRAATSLA